MTTQDDDSAGTDDPPTVGGVVLAAGQSTRFAGGNKLTATVEGVPIVRRAAESLVDSHLDETVVVVGHEAAAVQETLDSLDVDFRRNERYDEGQSTSVEAGVTAARDRGWDATLFALGDMPFVQSQTVDVVLSAYLAGRGSIVAAAYEGTRGNPTLFDAVHYDALAAVTGDRGGRRLIESHDDSILVETNDPGVTRDVDDEADLAKYTE